MTYFSLITELKNCALEEPNIRFAGSKDIFELNSLPDIEYSVFYITPNPFNMSEDLDRVSLNLYYVSRWDETDNNQLLIHSEGMIALRNILNRFSNRFEDVQIVYPFNCQPFYQKFKDMCCGVYFTVTFEIDSVLGLCNDE